MGKNSIMYVDQSLAIRLEAIDFERLPISDYNKRYISKLKPALKYYMEIYANCLAIVESLNRIPLNELIVVDYGGGSGFLSILAKEYRIRQVIYVDLNPNSVETVQVLKKEIGLGPDIILHGDSKTLAEWCRNTQTQPHLLIGTDLIEHVYDLNAFFNDLTSISNQMQMVFTTASTPYNPFIKRRLHRLMANCESGNAESPNYYTLRKQFIEKNYPQFTPAEVVLWSKQTRGLIFSDIKKAIDKQIVPTPEDTYNTCDPTNGNWTERILPIEKYRSLLTPLGYTLQVNKGFFNKKRKNPVLNLISLIINKMIRHSGKAGLRLSPFLFLLCTSQHPDSQ